MKLIKNYNVSADLIRILAAFFVVFSHSTDRFVLYTILKDSTAWNIIYYMNTLSRVAVPLFIILSGYLLLNKEKITNTKNFYIKRVSRILYPFIIWLTIYYGWTIYWDQTKLTPGFILQTLWTGNIWHLYFLIIILELYLLTPCLERFKTKKQQTVLFWSLLALSIFCSLLTIFHIDVKNYSLTMFIPYISLFFAGAYLRDLKVTKLWTIIFFVFYLSLAFITNKIANGNMSTMIVYNYSPTLLPMTICLFLALKNFHKNFGTKLLTGPLEKVIAYIGRLTFGIYLLHFLVLDLVLKDLHLLPWELHAPLILWACVPSIITFIISFIVIAFIKKLPYSYYLIG
ncbi:MAG TPA: acyltransferase family protein [Candidatus Sulfotelmatobacter sp.]|jgi:surface polysaccharide O-acyltransferase-like enzyme|nr:acyltransferase family protein [Candidatus Sulfotelmatobacter sp.]